MRAVFGLDSCRLFPLRVLVVILLIGDVQVRGPPVLPGRVGAVVGAQSRDRWQLQWSASASGVRDGSGGSSPPPGPRVGGALLPESARTEKEAPMAVPPLSSCTPQQWPLAFLAGPSFFPYSLSYGAPHSSPLRLSPRSQLQSSPWV